MTVRPGIASGRAFREIAQQRLQREKLASPQTSGRPSMSTTTPRLAITMGDPAGIGPEIILKACRRLQPRLAAGELRLLVIGHRSQLRAASQVLNEALDVPETSAQADWPAVALLPAGDEQAPIAFGQIAPEAGRFAYLAVERAVELAQAGRIDAIVTAPLNKAALNLAGYHYAGHTDMLAALTNTKSSVMLLAHGDMRVSHVTTHVALADVPRLLTPERLRRTIDLTQAALLDLGIARPRIAVAALNPHAGEGGLFGRQDIDISTPVIETCRAEGLDVTGPVPGDTVFVKLRARQFDAVVAMYHDQGHIPVKLLGFDVDPATGVWRALSGVNITLGLPVIRTSVDHGTAFDIAGKGVANEESLIEAIDYAMRLAATRRERAAG
jgi:4-hydroxythreonine-4-phosphate dehydrogenase